MAPEILRFIYFDGNFVMVSKEKKRFYDNFSRKELQNMCKQYGLPANKSHSDLEKSLITYLEEGINGSICNLQKTSQSKCNGSSINNRKAQRKTSQERFFSSSKDNFVEVMPQTKCRDKDDSSCPAENSLASAIESSPNVRFSSFEFYVRSEEGINLYVDLNSSPSDWTQRFKNEVHICENVQNNKCRSLHEDLGHLKEGGKEMRNSFWNIDAGEIKEGQIETRCSPNSKVSQNDHSELNEPENFETLTRFTIQPCTASVDVLEKSKEDQTPKSSEFNSTAHDNIISVADSCAKDGGTVVLDSDVIGAHHTKSVCDSAVNSISDDPLIPERLDHLNSNVSQHENTFLQNGCSDADPTVIYTGCSVSGSIDMQSSEVASCNKDASCSRCENSGLMSGFDTKNNTETEKTRLANLSEPDPNSYKKHLPALDEEREKSNILKETESSECSQFSKSSRKTCLSSHTLDTRGLQKRRIETDQSSYGRASAMFFRSTKPITRKDFPRRSMRLKSKLVDKFCTTIFLAVFVCASFEKQAVSEWTWATLKDRHIQFLMEKL
ncbi:hypothetical protein G4B88_015813 [Cannabis sativa]|uniref:Uncharacterized protein n=2 Tax=Cannabis sativa TaxID=3483 RepID=A0A7J6G483_CANSA|nr:hypothetical protein G4B88_015813 [Cannabis sativa]